MAGGAFGGYVFAGGLAEVVVHGALGYGKEVLGVAVFVWGGIEAVEAAVEPAVGEVHGVLRVLVFGIGGRALVEGHHDVRPDGALYVHYGFGGEEVLAAVDMALEYYTLFGDLAVGGEGEYLEAAAVGEYGAVPVHEAVEAAGGFHGFHAGTQIQVIGIAQDNVGVYLFLQVLLGNGLYAAHGSYGHEDGGFYPAVAGGDGAGTGGGAIICLEQFER
jgi:hypothetical protein